MILSTSSDSLGNRKKKEETLVLIDHFFSDVKHTINMEWMDEVPAQDNIALPLFKILERRQNRSRFTQAMLERGSRRPEANGLQYVMSKE